MHKRIHPIAGVFFKASRVKITNKMVSAQSTWHPPHLRCLTMAMDRSASEPQLPRRDGDITVDALANLYPKPRRVIKRRQNLLEIHGSKEHRLALEDWNAELTASCNSLDRNLSSRNSCTSELYQILGLFFVFHGLILTAVAQASAVKCHNSWLIFALSTMVSVATLFGCIQKLKELEEAKRNILQEKAVCSALFQSIQQLKSKGLAFDLEMWQPDLPPTFSDRIDQVIFFRVRSYMGAVFSLLLAFSGVNLAAIHLIVCDPQRNTLSG